MRFLKEYINSNVIRFLKYISGTVVAIAFLLFLLLMSMRLDDVKHRLASLVSVTVTDELGIPIDVESVEVRSLNDVRLKNVTIYDLAADTIVHAAELRAYLQTGQLLNGKVRVNTLVFDSPDIRLTRATPESVLNVQFIVDLLNKNKKDEESGLDLRINQILAYDGVFSYDVLDQACDTTGFDANHISVTGFSCNASLKKLLRNDMDLYVRSLCGKERSGLDVERLRFRVVKEGDLVHVSNLDLRTPLSNVAADRIEISTGATSDDITLTGAIRSTCFSPEELAPFIRLPESRISPFTFDIDGFYSRECIQMGVAAYSIDDSFGTKASVTLVDPFVEQRNGHLVVEEFFADDDVTDALVALAKLDTHRYDVADKLGRIFLDCDVVFDRESLDGEVYLGCRSGNLLVDGSVVSDGQYSFSAKAADLRLGLLTGVGRLDGCDVNIEASGDFKDASQLAVFKGEIEDLLYNDYRYEPFVFSGRYTSDAVTARLSVDDPNAMMHLTARYGLADERVLKLSLKTDRFVPAGLNLIEDEREQNFAFTLNGEYFDYGAGKTIVNAKIDNILLTDESDTTFVRNFYVSDNKAGDDRLFVVTSDFATASIYGDFDFKSILNSLKATLKSHLPVLELETADEETPALLANDFYYDVLITNSTPLTKILDLPVTVLEPSRIRGGYNEQERLFTIDATINRMNMKGGLIRSLNVSGKSGDKGLDFNVQFNKPMVKNLKDFDYSNLEEDIVVRLNANVASNKIKGLVNWNNFKSDDVMMGMLRMDAALSRDCEHGLELSAKIHKDSIIHRNQVWNISEGTISGKTDKLHVKNIGLSSNGQDLRVEGVIGKERSDSLNAYLNNVDVATVFDFIRFRILDFGGKASGTAHLTGLLSAPDAGGRIDVSDFSIDGAVLGRGDVYVGWKDELKSIVLDAGVYNKDNELTTVQGLLSQVHDTITLKIDAENVNAAFLDKKLSAFLSDLDGTGSGKVHIHGKWRSVDLEGAVALFCSAKVNANNTRYYFTGDSIKLSHGEMSFDNARVFDRYGNRGTLSGTLNHKNMSQWTCNFNVKANEMLVYDTNDFGSLPFYGTVFATGDALIKSDGKGLLLKANATSTPGSRFVYDANDASGAQDNSFVTFTDNSKRKKKESSVEKESAVKDLYNTMASKLTLDFMLDINESLEVKVYTDQQTDDYISLYGNGPINAIYSDKTGFSMKGHLNLARGTFKFTIQDIFPKVFDIVKGGTLAFNGDPYKAELDLKAKYLVPSASLSDLTTEIAKRKTVKVNCVMNVTGSLESPNLAFDLELPEGSEEERELLASVASTPDQKNMQFVYLLGVGKFYTFDTNSALATGSNSSTAVESLISNTISGQLNNMLGKIINNGNWDISGNISTSERGWNSMEVEGMLRGRLLNNRLQINGNLGYRENPIANRNFIGDFELLWLLSPHYNWNIKAYSKTNDRYFSKTDLTTQGIGTSILFEFDSWKWWSKKKDKKKKRNGDEAVDVESGNMEEKQSDAGNNE